MRLWYVVLAMALAVPSHALWGVPRGEVERGSYADIQLARAVPHPRFPYQQSASPIRLAGLAPPIDLLQPRPESDRPEPPLKPESDSKPTEPAPEEEKPFQPLVLMQAPDVPPTQNEICAMLEAEANVRELPAVFFVRLIWQESRFDVDALSPKGAQGIAQFMPATAKERGLEDPHDAVQAIGASAELLSDLQAMFGNWGLAAAAYNAGPGRVQKWLAGKVSLPRETRNYVKSITDLTASSWKKRSRTLPKSLSASISSVQDWCRAFRMAPSKQPEVQEADTTPTELSKPWGVQIAAGPTQEKALSLLAKAKAEHADILAEHKPAVVRRREPGRGPEPVYAVRIGLDTREAANELCSQFKKSGGVCTVGKNG